MTRRNSAVVSDPDKLPDVPADDPPTEPTERSKWSDVASEWIAASAIYGEACDKIRQYSCIYCDHQAESADHVVARHWGGPNDVLNLVPVCRSCNSMKSHGDVLDLLVKLYGGPGLGTSRNRPRNLFAAFRIEQTVLEAMAADKEAAK
jgi:hypothetical protein